MSQNRCSQELVYGLDAIIFLAYYFTIIKTITAIIIPPIATIIMISATITTTIISATITTTTITTTIISATSNLPHLPFLRCQFISRYLISNFHFNFIFHLRRLHFIQLLLHLHFVQLLVHLHLHCLLPIPLLLNIIATLCSDAHTSGHAFFRLHPIRLHHIPIQLYTLIQIIGLTCEYYDESSF